MTAPEVVRPPFALKEMSAKSLAQFYILIMINNASHDLRNKLNNKNYFDAKAFTIVPWRPRNRSVSLHQGQHHQLAHVSY